MNYNNKKVMVVGMGLSGVACAELLYQLGAYVILNDSKKLSDFDEESQKLFGEIAKEMYLGENPIDAIKDIDMMVLSPGVPPRLDFIQKAYELNKEVIAEMELGYRHSKGDFVAITGTNGKTTSTALAGEMFKNSGRTTHVLGNIGIPLAKMALNTDEGDAIVLESAALQLETIADFKPKVSAVLNITEDHLDRFLTMEYYIECKELVYKNQNENDYCVLNYDNEITRLMAEKTKSKVVWFSRKEILDYGVFLKDDNIIFKDGISETFIIDKNDVKIPGDHNIENALACAGMAFVCGVSPQVIRKTLIEFGGVEHRIEFVREFDGVRYINDSKGTNPDATINAIKAMDRPTVLILGGYDKKNCFDELFEMFTDEIETVIAIGETKENLLSSAKKSSFSNIYTADGFDSAIMMAKDYACEGYNVLLSPACASYDMFKNFEIRGETFKDIVNGL